MGRGCLVGNLGNNVNFSCLQVNVSHPYTQPLLYIVKLAINTGWLVSSFYDAPVVFLTIEQKNISVRGYGDEISRARLRRWFHHPIAPLEKPFFEDQFTKFSVRVGPYHLKAFRKSHLGLSIYTDCDSLSTVHGPTTRFFLAFRIFSYNIAHITVYSGEFNGYDPLEKHSRAP